MRYFADNSAAVLGGRSAPLLAAAAKRAWNTVTAPVRSYVQRDAIYRELSGLDDRMLAVPHEVRENTRGQQRVITPPPH